MDPRLTFAFLLAVPIIAGAQTPPALTLDAAVRGALEGHPHLGAAAERVRAARGSRLTARSWTNPILTYEVEQAPLPGSAGHVDLERETKLSLMLPIEPTFQLWSRSSRASAELRRAEADLRDARRMVIMQAADAFHRTATAQITVEAGEDIRAWLDSLVEYTRKRVGAGAAAGADLIRLEVEQGRVETDLAMARVELARASAELGALVGTDTVTVDVSTDSGPARLALPSLDRLLGLARQNRPDLQAARATVDVASAALAIERTAIVRELAATAGIMTVHGERSLMAGVSMPFPLFDQNRGEIQRAGAERRAASFDQTFVERRVVADVASAYVAVQALSAQVARIGGSLLQRALEGRRIAEGAYREGAVPLVHVLDAARAFTEARTLYYRALFALRQSTIELNAAIGSNDLTTLPRSEVR